jgi:type I restriction enzyme, S subunit
MSLMRIDDLFHFEKGSLQSSKCTEGAFDFITASAEWKTHNEYTHDCEALVFAAAASGSLGRTHYVHGKFISSDLCFIITPKNQSKLPIDLKFYHMIFNEFKNDIVNSTKAGTSKEAIGMKAFGNYKLPYFEFSKQTETRIQFMNMQHSKVELNSELTHQLDLIKQLRQAFLREAMQGKLITNDELGITNGETGHELLAKIKAEKAQLIAEKKLKKEKELSPITADGIPFEIPEHWAWCRLGDFVLNFQNGISSRGETDGDMITVLRLADITFNKVDLTDLRQIKLGKKTYERYLLDKNDILITRVNGSLELVGNFNFVGNTNIKITACDHFIRMQLPKNLCSFFIFLLGRMPHIRKSIEENFKTTSGQKTVNQGHINNLLIPLPPLHEQEQIVAKLEELMAFCDGLEQSIKESQGYNEKLLQQVLREALQG